MPGHQVSIYKNVLDTTGKPIELSKILNAIKSGHWKNTIEKLRVITEEKEQKAFKNTLPCFTPSGVFSTRTVEGLKEHSGILVIDIDTKENPGLLNECNEIRQHLIEDKYTYFLFDSCRGIGLAIGVLIDKSRHIDTFNFLETYYKDKHGLNIDKGCKDVSRLRFVSDDPQIFQNDKAEIVKAPVVEHVLTNYDKIKAIVSSGKMLGDDTYDSWLQQGFALANEFGEDGRTFYHALSQRSSKYDQADCDKKYDNCIRTNKGSYTFATIIHLAKQAGVSFNGKVSVSTKKETVSLTDEIGVWLEQHTGEILINDIYRDLNLMDKNQKSNSRKIIHRLVEKKELKPDKKKSGCYHKINNTSEVIDWEHADLTEVPMSYPLELEKLFITLKRTIIVVAGVSDAGKTAFLMHCAALNAGRKLPVRYFSSEMGDAELRFRIDRTDIPKEVWKQIDFRERYEDFCEGIDPDAINIIDYIEIFENTYLIGKHIKDVFDKLNNGIAIIAIQKDSKKEQGLGGMFSMHKSRLYLNIDYEQLQIVKCKNKRYMESNLRGQKIKFRINRGLLESTSDWFK